MQPLRMPWLLLILLASVLAIYWPGLTGGFVFDDYPNIVQNNSLHVSRLAWDEWSAAIFSSGSSELKRPLAMLSFAINHYFTGLDPWPMKLTGLSVHLLNVVLVFFLVRTLLRTQVEPGISRLSLLAPWFVAAWWALLPINFMAVLLIVQRMETLANAFVLAGLWLYVNGRLRQQTDASAGWGRVLAGLLLFTVLGVLSKESAVLLPLYAFLVECLVFRFKSQLGIDRRLIGLFACGLALPALVGVPWLLSRALKPWAYASRGFDLSQRLWTELRVVVDYLRWSLLPKLSQLGLFHDDYAISTGWISPPATIWSMLIIAILLAVAWLCRRRRPLVSLGLLWFFAAQLLTATFIPLELVFEHRNYFASLGLCLVLADLLLLHALTTFQHRVALASAASLLIFYAGSTHLRAREWSDPIRFAQTEAAKHPLSPRATYHLAQAYAIASRGDPASPFINAAFLAFERARRVPGAGISAAQGALLLAARTGANPDPQWWLEMRDRLRESPVGPQELGALGALTDCAIARLCLFPPEQMLLIFTAALSHGDDPKVLNIYGNYVLNVLGEVELTERLWREAGRLRPTEPQFAVSVAKLMIALDRFEEARVEISRLRAMGTLGQYEQMARGLDLRLERAQKARANRKK